MDISKLSLVGNFQDLYIYVSDREHNSLTHILKIDPNLRIVRYGANVYQYEYIGRCNCDNYTDVLLLISSTETVLMYANDSLDLVIESVSNTSLLEHLSNLVRFNVLDSYSALWLNNSPDYHIDLSRASGEYNGQDVILTQITDKATHEVPMSLRKGLMGINYAKLDYKRSNLMRAFIYAKCDGKLIASGYSTRLHLDREELIAMYPNSVELCKGQLITVGNGKYISFRWIEWNEGIEKDLAYDEELVDYQPIKTRKVDLSQWMCVEIEHRSSVLNRSGGTRNKTSYLTKFN